MWIVQTVMVAIIVAGSMLLISWQGGPTWAGMATGLIVGAIFVLDSSRADREDFEELESTLSEIAWELSVLKDMIGPDARELRERQETDEFLRNLR